MSASLHVDREGATMSSKVAAVAGLILLAAPTSAAVAVEPGPVAGNSRMFEFSVCNRAGSTASVALSAHYAPGSKDYVVAGWWQVAPGRCRTIGHYPRGHFYTHATATRASWGRGDVKLCVETPGPFKRINFKGVSCPTGLLRPFTHVDVQQPTFQLTLNP
jgi:uncharacterized membrane protein